jgi:hypothetical protein
LHSNTLVWKEKNNLLIKLAPSLYTKIYRDYQWDYGVDGMGVLSLPYSKQETVLSIVSYYDQHIRREDFLLSNLLLQRERDYQQGDILVASDNIKQELSGYMGHSALVVDPEYLVEATGGHPAIEKDSIQQFLEKHPIHAHFRPKDKEMGKMAANFATAYYEKYKDNISKDIKKPVFSFQLSQELDDIWEFIYCSKLIWVSYHYGAEYTFENDHLWFSPEDLFHILSEDENFEIVYKHPEVKFLINT